MKTISSSKRLHLKLNIFSILAMHVFFLKCPSQTRYSNVIDNSKQKAERVNMYKVFRYI